MCVGDDLIWSSFPGIGIIAAYCRIPKCVFEEFIIVHSLCVKKKLIVYHFATRSVIVQVLGCMVGILKSHPGWRDFYALPFLIIVFYSDHRHLMIAKPILSLSRRSGKLFGKEVLLGVWRPDGDDRHNVGCDQVWRDQHNSPNRPLWGPTPLPCLNSWVQISWYRHRLHSPGFLTPSPQAWET